MVDEILDDTEAVRAWWDRISTAVPSEVRGLWFGLFEERAGPSPEADSRFTMYVVGSPSFDPEDGGDWATDEFWVPEDRYIRPHGLGAIATTDWPAALDHAVHLVQQLRPWTAAPSTLRGVGVGFDDGDVVIAWSRADR